ncbi:MAG: thymidine phosphorylase [Bacteroidetes bacterium]|jgi:pyrimidine-nucleoside phosphorylase|nr:thymidine phosphorylase [Bacteroidota bacterium]
MTNPVELIRRKRDGAALTREELSGLVGAYTRGELPDYQMSAFLMACYFRGMTEDEMLAFTDLMLHSGTVLDLSDVPGIKVDKHSTGGVGDKVSLLLAPIVAACGVPVPMISGRGLGHTGGTLDKLETIPGFRTDLSIDDFRRVLRDVGCVLIGQTGEIAPADKKMYALRDVTATVECIPLIAGSIMSKKLAEGIDALVLDIKTGRGAFMEKTDRAIELGSALVSIGERAGKRTVGYVTDMSQPLGTHVGNWLEVVESVECLRSGDRTPDGSADLMELTLLLSGTMIWLGGKAGSVEDGIDRSRGAVRNGAACAKLLDIVRAQGGSVGAIERLDAYPPAAHQLTIAAESDGWLSSIDALELGLSGILLGAGRKAVADRIDPLAGMVLNKKRGDAIKKGDTLVTVHASDRSRLESASTRIRAAFTVTSTKPSPQPLIVATITKEGVRTGLASL